MDEINNKAFNEEMSERVDRFLRKEMSEAESKAFLEEVKTNPELKDYYQRQFNLMRGIQFQQLKELMREKEAELTTVSTPWWKKIVGKSGSPEWGPAQADQTGGTVVMKRFRYAYAVTAVAAAMVCGVFVWDNSVTRHVGTEELSVVWKGGDPIDERIDAGEYQKAIELIDEELGKTYELGDDPNAIAAYTQAMNDLKYRKALVYLKMGKKRAAKSILKELDDTRSNAVLDKLLW